MSDNTPEKPTLKQQIDGDEQLQKLGRKLSILSLLFMGVMLTGATIEEANTFVFKVKVTTQEAIPAMFLLSVIYLLFRYYTYARPYQKVIDRSWLNRLERDPVLFQYDDQADEVFGLVVEIEPKSVNLNWHQHQGPEPDEKWHFYYRVSGVGLRQILYSGGHVKSPYIDEISVNLFEALDIKTYVKVLWVETKYQLASFVEDKERLDLWGPYLIAILAILSFFFRSDFQQLVKALVNFAST